METPHVSHCEWRMHSRRRCVAISGLRTLTERLAVFGKLSAARGPIACRGGQDLYLGSEGGCVIVAHSSLGKDMRVLRRCSAEARQRRTHSSLPRGQHLQLLNVSRNHKFNTTVTYNSCSELGKRLWQSSEFVSTTTVSSGKLDEDATGSHNVRGCRTSTRCRWKQEFPRLLKKPRGPTTTRHLWTCYALHRSWHMMVPCGYR